ncbi:MAG: hypothetical protein AUJ92_09955 [Armatimonadetes bacterium CG2_30_59_28]|nr:MAG: hypothetical protein AUJ92_09955 [Armatimonadetes bacterium CG2_30_59_28]
MQKAFHIVILLLSVARVGTVAAETVKLSDLRANPQKYSGQTLGFSGIVDGIIASAEATTLIFRGTEGDRVYIKGGHVVPEAKPGRYVSVSVRVPPNSGYVASLELVGIVASAPPPAPTPMPMPTTAAVAPPQAATTSASSPSSQSGTAPGNYRLMDGEGKTLQSRSKTTASSPAAKSLPSRGVASSADRTIAAMIPTYKKTIQQFNPKLDDARLTQLADLILRYGYQSNVDPRLVVAVIAAESNFRLEATSPSGAMGLGQLMPGTAAGMGVSNAYDPEQNLRAAIRIISGHLKKYGNHSDGFYRALAAYNAGSGAVRKYGGVPPYRETVNYIWKIYGLYKQLAPDQFK